MEEAIATLRGGHGVELTCAGRTDRGVHAWGQVVSHAGEPVALEGLNALLPARRGGAGLRARRPTASTPAATRSRGPTAFGSTPDRWRHRSRSAGRCTGRTRSIATRSPRAQRRLIGRHDFTAFTPTETEHVRFDRVVLSAEWHRRGDTLEFWITADAFMRHMNRVLVGTMLQVAGRPALAATRSSRCSMVGHAKRRDRRPRRTGSTSPRSAFG